MMLGHAVGTGSGRVVHRVSLRHGAPFWTRPAAARTFCVPTHKNAVVDSRDVEFQLFEVMQLGKVLQWPRFSHHDADGVRDMLGLAEKLALHHFAPINAKGDQHPPVWDPATGRVTVYPPAKEAVLEYYRAGFGSMGFSLENGGMQIPVTVATATTLAFAAANVSLLVWPALSQGAANVIAKYASARLKEQYLAPMIEGRFAGTMNLSEPQAGSSLGDITARAVQSDDGSYRIHGKKMWISGGDHDVCDNVVHLVLAKVKKHDGEASSRGVRDISLFLVPRNMLNADGTVGARNDVTVAGLNHKMGYNVAPNCFMSYGDNDGAVGWLVGKEGRGLECMFNMMNEARIGVGVGAAGLGYAGYAYSLDYARNRPQGRHLAEKDPNKPQIPIVEHADVRRMLLSQKASVEGAVSLCLYAASLVDNEHATEAAVREDSLLLLDVLTPIVKAWPSEWCLEANKWGQQVLGGVGYTQDYPLEQIYRDNRLNMIHEGTNGIQSLDLLGRKVLQHDGRGLAILAKEIMGTVAEAKKVPDLQPYAETLDKAVGTVRNVTVLLGKAGATKGPALMLANSHDYLNMCGHTVIAWRWLCQGLAAHQGLRAEGPAGPSSDFYRGKLHTCRFFFNHELPKGTLGHAKILQSLDDTNITMKTEWF